MCGLKRCASCQEFEAVLFQSYNSSVGGLSAIVVARRFRAIVVLRTIRINSQRQVSGVVAMINKTKNIETVLRDRTNIM